MKHAREKNQEICRWKSLALFFALVFFVGASFAFSQVPLPKPEIPRAPAAPKPNRNSVIKIINESDVAAEKSIVVDARVNVQLCVNEGKIKINGWERGEIRAFVGAGSAVGFKVLQRGKTGGAPVWVEVLGYEAAKNKEANPDECLSGETIEIDVPRGATVNIKSRESETAVDSVDKVTVENVGGDIFLSNIARGIHAKTYEGDVTVEKSAGAMTLLATSGNIVVLDVAPIDVGDAFKANTNSGAVIMQRAEHRQIEAVTNSGTIKFTGALQSGGQYNFRAFNGAVNLSIPQNSSSKINASYGFGTFASEISMRNVVKSAPAAAQNLSAQIGAGEAALNLTTYSGAIRIRKQ